MQHAEEKSLDISQGSYVPVGSAEYSAVVTFLYE